MNFPTLTIRRACRLLKTSKVTSEDLVGYCHSLAVAGEDVWGLNAYSFRVDRDDLIHKARQSDDRRRKGKELSFLDGIPVSIKANMAVEDWPLTAGSQILGFGSGDDNAVPACGYDADTVRILLRDCGALLVGITNMDEFGMGSLGTNSFLPNGARRATKNPLPMLSRLRLPAEIHSTIKNTAADDDDLASIIKMPHDAIMEAHAQAVEVEEPIYSAGGSSCGSAASVSHGSALVSLGTDTGGSVRLPAAWCGLVGLKPSYGLLSRHGLVSYASSFDTVGILARTTDCARQTLDILATKQAEETRDSTVSSLPTSYSLQKESSQAEDLTGTRIGIPHSFVLKECSPSVLDVWSRGAEKLLKAGAEIVEIPSDETFLELVQQTLAAYYILVSAEASSNLSRYDGFRYGQQPSSTESRPMELSQSNKLFGVSHLEHQFAAARVEGFGVETTRRILCGASVLSSDRFHSQFESASKIRSKLTKQISSLLENEADLLLIPTVMSSPCQIDDSVGNVELFVNDLMTVSPSLCGLPAISIPLTSGEERFFKKSMQLIGSRLNEAELLRVGQVLEE